MPRAHPTHFVKYGGWLPSNADIHTSFINTHVQIAQDAVLRVEAPQHQPAVEEFKNTIEGDAVMKDLFKQIFNQVHEKNKVSNPADVYET